MTLTVQDMAADIGGMTCDPLRFILYALPWGSGSLSGAVGPHPWQADVLRQIGSHLRDGATVHQAIRMAIASGHGIGKSALVAWLILWAMSTHEDTRGVVTANTDTQLRTKTWPEVVKWHGMMINRDWFTCEATSIYNPSRRQTWRMDAIPWSETRTESFHGLHNLGKRILVVYDEASSIPDKIWEVTEGAMTDEATEIIWVVCGNPTRNTGRFRECFGSLRHRWKTWQIDARQVPGTNKAQIDQWIEDYGEDSDFVRVRVRGVFPRSSAMQFISSEVVRSASNRPALCNPYDALIMGVDVARFGDDQSVIRFRRGLDARSIPPVKLRGVDTMTLAGRIAQVIADQRAKLDRVDAIFIDEGSMGAGVIDRLRQLGHEPIGINFGSSADGGLGEIAPARKTDEMWVRMRQWLSDGGAIDADPELQADLEGREFGYDVKNRIVLEKKDNMKKRGLSSPDNADALALTFAMPVAPRDQSGYGVGRTVTANIGERPFWDE